ncbi:hypothetical protein [Roseomonas marmotae]|uniref:Uncharacterized protein n=1 Tax=Roseomonas marmotae TaxID=2768161 RepID=A0ABS3KAY1_9PROT|nr:hypothetical protein [Roseomonas marmotae]MBO1074620.1 hypothetical protein [Roseomonas marmotae]QTI81643.1 hypothetical protein IAI58_20165 [Roseomonas marmotae]
MPLHQAATIYSATDALDTLGDRLDRAVLEATTKIKELQAAVTEQARRAEAMEQHVADLERQLAVATAKLAVEMMHSAGLEAQASHLMAVAIEPGVPALAELIEERNLGGKPKSRLSQIYETAFDTKAAELGIEDPARFRLS